MIDTRLRRKLHRCSFTKNVDNPVAISMAAHRVDNGLDARRQRTPPHHGHRRAGAGEPRFLRRRAGHAARQAQRQPGRSRHLSPFLRRRGRASRHRISRSFRGPQMAPPRARARPGDGSRARGARRAASATGASASRRYGTRVGARRDAIRRTRAAASSTRTACAWRSSSATGRPAVHAVGRESRACRAADSRTATARSCGSGMLGAPRAS